MATVRKAALPISLSPVIVEYFFPFFPTSIYQPLKVKEFYVSFLDLEN